MYTQWECIVREKYHIDAFQLLRTIVKKSNFLFDCKLAAELKSSKRQLVGHRHSIFRSKNSGRIKLSRSLCGVEMLLQLLPIFVVSKRTKRPSFRYFRQALLPHASLCQFGIFCSEWTDFDWVAPFLHREKNYNFVRGFLENLFLLEICKQNAKNTFLSRRFNIYNFFIIGRVIQVESLLISAVKVGFFSCEI